MKGEKAVARPKAAESVNSLSIVCSGEIFSAAKASESRPYVTNLKTIFGGHKILSTMLKLFAFATVLSAATAFSPFMVRHSFFF